jgi:hypothetical protein
MERRWNEDEKRAGIRGCFAGLPWASFALIARQLRGVPAGDVSAARKRCLDYSRIAELEKFIEDQFFSQRAIIKRCQLLEKTNRVYAPSIKTIKAEAERLGEDYRNAGRAAASFKSHSPDLSKSMAAKAACNQDEGAEFSDKVRRKNRGSSKSHNGKCEGVSKRITTE